MSKAITNKILRNLSTEQLCKMRAAFEEDYLTREKPTKSYSYNSLKRNPDGSYMTLYAQDRWREFQYAAVWGCENL